MSGYIGSTPVPQATQHRESFTCTEGQTTFNTAGYTAQFVDVYLNGSHLSPADFTATNGSDVVLGVAASADDVCDIISYTPFEVAAQTFTGTTTMTDVVAATLDISGNIDIDGVTNLDAVDIDGAVQIDNTVNVGVDDTGYDVKFFGDTASAYMQWDASTDDLILGGASTLGIGTASPLRQLHISNTSANSEIAFTAGTSGTSSLLFGDGLTGTDVYKGYLQYQHNGDYMLLASAGATVVRLDSDGLKFGADSAAANALDDYEEGAVSLTLVGGNGNPNTAVAITGTYVKIGRLVSVRAQNLNFNSTGAQGPIALTGLPFAANGAYGIGSIGEVNDIMTFTNSPFLVASGTDSYVFENISEANSVTVNHHVDTAGAINIDVTYETNS